MISCICPRSAEQRYQVSGLRFSEGRQNLGFTNHVFETPSYTDSMPDEVEIKFQIGDLQRLTRALQEAGFHLKTPRTHEMNTLYDLPGKRLRRKGELLRLRQYGSEWILTHKAKGKAGRHKSRAETEARVDDGVQMDAILRNLGFQPSFRYEKFRAEWSDGAGHVVVDETPIVNIGEIEGE